MVEIQVLPPQKAKAQVSVRQVAKTLGEHFLGFLAANNLQGFLKDEDRYLDDSNIVDRLVLAAFSEGMTVEQFRDQAEHIRDMSEGVLTRRVAQDYLARAMGYKDYIDVKSRAVKLRGNSRKDSWVPSRWDRKAEAVNAAVNAEADQLAGIGGYVRLYYRQFLENLSEPWDGQMVSVVSYMRKIAKYPSQTREKCKELARDIQTISNGHLNLAAGYTMVAMALGYRSWRLAKKSSPLTEHIKNRRYGDPFIKLFAEGNEHDSQSPK